MSAKCRSCGAEIIWAITTRGKRIPLNAEPTMKGNMVIVDDVIALEHGMSTPPLARAVSPMLEPGQVRYLPHHAVCPEANRWRR